MSKTVAVIERTPLGYGVSFPDFPCAGTSAATVEEVLARAEVTLDAHIDAIMRYGGEMPNHMRSVEEIIADPDHRELIEEVGPVTYALVEVPLPSKSVRVNVTLDQSLLKRIDHKAKSLGESRSGFLAAAARARLSG